MDVVDTWQFGTGTPSQTAGASQLTRAGAFPPHPPTVVGAVRALLARSRGWQGDGAWPQEFHSVLGDGPEDMGGLRFVGPFILRTAQGGDHVVVPVPAAARRVPGPDGDALVLGVRPAEELVCDLGAVRLPREDYPVPVSGYLRVDEVQALLAGGRVPAAGLVPLEEMWVAEERTGLKRDPTTRAAEEGALFRIVHHRARPGSGGLVEFVDGLPGDWVVPPGLTTFGAEARLAEVSVLDGGSGLLEEPPAWGEIERTRRAVLAALTPMVLGPAAWCGREPVPGLSGARVVCGVSEPPLRIGGWDGRRRVPVAQCSVLPAGSVLYVEHDDGAALAVALNGRAGLAQIGNRTAEGFGTALAAPWPE